LRFANGVNTHLTYGKGSFVQRGDRRFVIHGEAGVLEFLGDHGTLTQGETVTPIELGSRRGVFKQDTTAVLDYLTEGKPLYITAVQSLYALEIADQIRRSAEMMGSSSSALG
jgi:biliverdin reductase